MSTKPMTIGATLYPGFEMLDMFGPLEMFSMLGTEQANILMISETGEPVNAAIAENIGSGPRVMADHSFAEAPALDIILLPGGFGTMPELENEAMLRFLSERAEEAQFVCSVCTGSLLLAKAGLLDNRRATTNKQFFSLNQLVPGPIEWIKEARWVEDGKMLTSSGVSAGMDMALALIAKLHGTEAAELAANSAEYTWHRDADTDPFVEHLDAGMAALAGAE